MAVQMLAAYYSKGCDSLDIFQGLEIGNDESFRQHLNQYDVICMDIQWMKTSAVQIRRQGERTDVITYMNEEVIEELRAAYPNCVSKKTVSLAKALADINIKLGIHLLSL